MIRSRTDLITYLASDQVAMERHCGSHGPCRDVMRFLRLLRHMEYWTNRERGPWSGAMCALHARRLHRQGRRCGFDVPPNVFGPGLVILSRGPVMVHPAARVGARCIMHVDVVIGPGPGTPDAVPVLGDGCRIGPGARLIGPIVIGDNSTIGANAVVERSFPQGHTTVAGAPAREMTEPEGPLLAFRLERAAFPVA